MLAIYLAALDSADNAEAFEAVYERYKRLVYHVACQIVHDPHLAEDVAQEVFLYIAKNPPAPAGPAQVCGLPCQLYTQPGVPAAGPAAGCSRRGRTGL